MIARAACKLKYASSKNPAPDGHSRFILVQATVMARRPTVFLLIEGILTVPSGISAIVVAIEDILHCCSRQIISASLRGYGHRFAYYRRLRVHCGSVY